MLLLPIATAAVLAHIRQLYSFARYLVATLPFIAVGVLTWMHTEDVILSYNGPRVAAGFRSWAVLAVILSIGVLCAIRTRDRLARIGQICAAAIVANVWFVVIAGWVS